MAGGIEFNPAKFKELVLLLSQLSRGRGDKKLGKTKLNKLLYRADFEAFRLLGQPITGAEYRKQEYGPVASELPRIIDELGQAGHLAWEQVETGPYTQKRPDAIETPDSTMFSDAEMEIIHRALDELEPLGGASVSRWSHRESVGWRLSKTGDPIPYEADIVASGPAPAEAVERLRQRVLSGNWD